MTSLTLSGVDADQPQPVLHRAEQRPAALCAHRRIEAGVEDEGPRRADDRPDEIVERHRAVMRIAEDEVVRGGAVVVAVADRVEFVGLAHVASGGLTSTPAHDSISRQIEVKSACGP